jgi:hypothetical protein
MRDEPARFQAQVETWPDVDRGPRVAKLAADAV